MPSPIAVRRFFSQRIVSPSHRMCYELCKSECVRAAMKVTLSHSHGWETHNNIFPHTGCVNIARRPLLWCAFAMPRILRPSLSLGRKILQKNSICGMKWLRYRTPAAYFASAVSKVDLPSTEERAGCQHPQREGENRCPARSPRRETQIGFVFSKQDPVKRAMRTIIPPPFAPLSFRTRSASSGQARCGIQLLRLDE